MDEKQGFSRRLKQALREAGVDVRSPTRIAVQFNLRHYGSPMSTQGVRKWLEGRSIPQPDKIRTLCKWLRVSLEWLSYGEGEKRAAKTGHVPEPDAMNRSDRIVALPDEFARLSARHKEMVCEIVQALLEMKK